MCCSSRPCRIGKCAVGRRLSIALAIAFAIVSIGAGMPSCAYAQRAPGPSRSPQPTPSPTPTPVPTPNQINADLSSGTEVLNLGSNFLERLGSQATGGFGAALRSNPEGGGASESAEAPRYRTWGELYGISATTGQQGEFAGDSRRTVGGLAGFGAGVAPGVNVGFSVDQSHTAIDVPLALQSATLDLTQLGFNASVDKGPWTWAVALVHGFGNVGSSRDTGMGFADASYNARLDGVLTELSYYWNMQQSRIVPKLGLEYVHASTGAFQETGGLDPLSASGAMLERARLLIGAEIGHDWVFDSKILDLSAYGKFVDNFSQNVSSVVVSLGPQSIAVQGIGESQYGADAGASASLSLTNAARLYLNYDGKFRSALQSHQGTLGVEFKW
ncbi:autotransporter outer membrane beta-barrel domain-containing protein [Bradyrhizobium sp.]|uniref:autotransporter outer membrane beta-barrel domain-containing protein n=1 Tax=Bradyrhizobium sp. TaxID=376 RepID=UPI003C6372C2